MSLVQSNDDAYLPIVTECQGFYHQTTLKDADYRKPDDDQTVYQIMTVTERNSL